MLYKIQGNFNQYKTLNLQELVIYRHSVDAAQDKYFLHYNVRKKSKNNLVRIDQQVSYGLFYKHRTD